MLILCAQCGKMIQRRRKLVAASKHSFCSRECCSAFRRTGYSVPCDWCGATTYKPPSRLKEQNFCGEACRRLWLGKYNVEVRNVPGHSAGHKAPHLTTLNRQRNPLMRIGEKGKAVPSARYRKIAEEILGRPLQRDEDVHHINGDRSDNRPENLMVLTRSEHHRLHARLACERMSAQQEGGDAHESHQE